MLNASAHPLWSDRAMAEWAWGLNLPAWTTGPENGCNSRSKPWPRSRRPPESPKALDSLFASSQKIQTLELCILLGFVGRTLLSAVLDLSFGPRLDDSLPKRHKKQSPRRR